MPTVPSAFPLLGAPQAPGDEPNLPKGSESLGGRPPEAVGNPQAPRHTLPEPRPDNTAGQSATQHLERSSPKSICHQNDRDWNLLVLELLPYMVDGLAHYAGKVGDTQHFPNYKPQPVQLAVAVEYTDCFSAEGQDSSIECPGYDIIQSDCEARVLELFAMWSTA